jgi:hypothetical protein
VRYDEVESVVGSHTLTDGSLDVTDNVADGVRVGGILLQLNLDLGDTSTGAGTAKNLGDFGVLDNGLILLFRTVRKGRGKQKTSCQFSVSLV